MTIIQNEIMPSALGSTSEVVLIGGRAPIRWQDMIAQSIVKLNDLLRSCDWIKSWEIGLHPTLHYGPLLGRTFVELIEQIAHGAEDSEQTRSRAIGKNAILRQEVSPAQSGIDNTYSFGHNLTKPTDQAVGMTALVTEVDLPQESRSSRAKYRHRLARDQDMAIESDILATTSPGSDSVTVQQKAQISKKSPDPFQMERQAGQSLLSRLAGDYVSAEGPSRSQYRPIRTISVSETKNSPTISRYMGDHRDWLYNLTLRAESSLRHLEFDALGVPSHTLPAWSLIPEKHLLAEQWQMSLDGKRAPIDLLIFLASLSERYMADFNRGHQLDSQSEVPADNLRDLLTQLQSGLEFEDSQSTVTGQIPSVGRELEAPARILPPSGAPSLPPLLPSQLVDVSSLPVAAVSVRHGAQQEVTTEIGDELSVLAAKIKRIMDEEARRYGIDV